MNRLYKYIYVIISAVILVLEYLPNGIRLFFFAGQNNSYVMTTSYPIYRWYKGLILPSVDNLFMLSRLLNVHMEELLVEKQDVLWLYKM